ncbi:MAG TPA: RNA polymerase sigma factor [Bacteroidales bacterium]|nr:RNA polymerase sigma factor [Bacteroidales bacterium]HPI87086.1 RNA polymerase sigma factor [Bacteroidales bacterium]HPM93536.1 RNA polymerase sigma factor [Bacteroidales bacterium]
MFLRYEENMLRYIRRISGADKNWAQDILQDAFIKVWKNLNDYDQGLKFSSWIYRIVHNETVSSMRKGKSFGKNKEVDIDLFRNTLFEEVVDQTDQSPDPGKVIQQITQLPVKYQEVMMLKFLEGKSYDEISDILRLPEGTIAIRISRAKKMLRQQHHE